MIDGPFDFTFEKRPVIAFRLPWSFQLTAVEGESIDRPKLFDRPWIVLNATGQPHLLRDDEFRPLYHPANEQTRAYVESIGG